MILLYSIYFIPCSGLFYCPGGQKVWVMHRYNPPHFDQSHQLQMTWRGTNTFSLLLDHVNTNKAKLYYATNNTSK